MESANAYNLHVCCDGKEKRGTKNQRKREGYEKERITEGGLCLRY